MRGLIWLAGGIAAGAILVAFYSPAPIASSGCGVERVLNKVETAYVLKPPTVAPIEHVTIVKEKCEPPAPVEEPKVEEEKPKRKWRHMRRHRRHW